MGEQQAMAADAGAITDDQRLGGIEKGVLHHDGVLADVQVRLRQHGAAGEDLLVDLGVIVDEDALHVEEGHGTDLDVALEGYLASAEDGGKPDAGTVADLQLFRHQHGQRPDADIVANARTLHPVEGHLQHRGQQPYGEHFEDGDALFIDQCSSHAEQKLAISRAIYCARYLVSAGTALLVPGGGMTIPSTSATEGISFNLPLSTSERSPAPIAPPKKL